MEVKEFKVQAPEGYEIDRENSTFECIKFKPIKNITYKQVAFNVNTTKNGCYYINSHGCIDFTKDGFGYQDSNSSNSKKQLEKILALNQLLNIAEYYNKIRGEYNIRYAITYDFDECEFTVKSSFNADVYSFGVVALFNSEDDAQAVIDNPNFREILDTIYKY